MKELERLLRTTPESRDSNTDVEFNSIKHRIRCFAHILNICSSHVAALFSDNESFVKLIAGLDDPKAQQWSKGLKGNPLERARRLVCFLRSSGQHKRSLQEYIQTGNKNKLFSLEDDGGTHVTVELPQLELVRDVETRWDSTYLMLDRLRALRPVSCLINGGWISEIDHPFT